ncbi:MAG: formate dehydrogenase accessory sulfurtransferase FdhD [Deltaproteobacteria bacterium]|nr:formate dehydrogenase accessory sulfurtransferase FdhD [Deltaproteobacteria bacterium]
MTERTANRPISRFYHGGKVRGIQDELLREFRLMIRVDGQDFLQVVVTPSLLEEFVLGFLLTRRLIKGPGDVHSLKIGKRTVSVVRTDRLRGIFPALGLLESTGTRNIALPSGKRPPVRMPASDLQVQSETVIKGVGMLSRMPLYQRTGATHCSILFSSSGEAIASAEDIGRHNSVDKVIGGGLMKGVDFGHCWLAVSGRLPRDMILKAVLAGIPLMASVSAATLDGVMAGERSGVTVIGFAREKRFNCYCHPERIA